MEENRAKKKMIITAVALGQLVLAIVISIYGTFSKKLIGTKGDLLIALSLLIFWALMDIVEPLALQRFDGITPQKKSAYLKFLILDFISLAGLAYFVFCMGKTTNNAIFGAIVYAVTIKPKRDSQDIFYGLADPDAQESEEADESSTEAPDESNAAQAAGERTADKE